MVSLTVFSSVQLAVLCLCAAFGGWTVWHARKLVLTSPLKLIMMGWYTIAAVLTIVYIPLKAACPVTGPHFTVFYNAAGQLIALTGIVDACHFLDSTHRLCSLSETRYFFLKIWGGVMVVGLVVYGIAAPLIHLDVMPLVAYRSFTLLVMGTEMCAYAFLLSRVHANKRAAFYYSVTLVGRVGLVAGIVCRMVGQSTDIIWVVHTVSAELTFVTIAVFGATEVLVAGTTDLALSLRKVMPSSRYATGSDRSKVTGSEMDTTCTAD